MTAAETPDSLTLLWYAVTEHEILRGMLQSPDPASTSFCITRSITNLLENIHCRRAHKFIDIATTNGNISVDDDAQSMLTSLWRDKIATVLGPQNITHFDVVWDNPQETNPNENTEYLRVFMEVFEVKMLELIEQAVTEQRSMTCDSHIIEVLQHLTVCRQRSQVNQSVSCYTV